VTGNEKHKATGAFGDSRKGNKKGINYTKLILVVLKQLNILWYNKKAS
jgi:hypothetical protein